MLKFVMVIGIFFIFGCIISAGIMLLGQKAIEKDFDLLLYKKFLKISKRFKRKGVIKN